MSEIDEASKLEDLNLRNQNIEISVSNYFNKASKRAERIEEEDRKLLFNSVGLPKEIHDFFNQHYDL